MLYGSYCYVFIEDFPRKLSPCMVKKIYHAVWQLLLYFYREFPSKILSVQGDANFVFPFFTQFFCFSFKFYSKFLFFLPWQLWGSRWRVRKNFLRLEPGHVIRPIQSPWYNVCKHQVRCSVLYIEFNQCPHSARDFMVNRSLRPTSIKLFFFLFFLLKKMPTGLLIKNSHFDFFFLIKKYANWIWLLLRHRGSTMEWMRNALSRVLIKFILVPKLIKVRTSLRIVSKIF